MDTLLFGIKLIVMTFGVLSLILLGAILLTMFISRTTNKRQNNTECTLKDEEDVKKCSLKTSEEELTPELLAVITAAVYESLGGTKYKITAIRRIKRNKVSPWSFAGRKEQMDSILN